MAVDAHTASHRVRWTAIQRTTNRRKGFGRESRQDVVHSLVQFPNPTTSSPTPHTGDEELTCLLLVFHLFLTHLTPQPVPACIPPPSCCTVDGCDGRLLGHPLICLEGPQATQEVGVVPGTEGDRLHGWCCCRGVSLGRRRGHSRRSRRSRAEHGGQGGGQTCCFCGILGNQCFHAFLGALK